MKAKNCPGCKNWWFNRRCYGCSKGHKQTYTSLTLMDHMHFYGIKNLRGMERCKDMEDK